MIKQKLTTYPAREIGKIIYAGGSTPYYIPSYTDGVHTTTYGNWGWPNPQHRADVGAPFFQKRFYHEYGGTGVTASFGGNTYTGSFYASVPQYSMPGVVPTAGAWGAELYSKMKPAQPEFDGLNALWELRDLPGMLRGRYTRDLAGASNYWLGLQFGWAPLLRDIRNLCTTQINGQKYLKQLLRDNGKKVRRGVVIKNDSTSVSQSYFGSYNLFHPVLLGSMYYSAPDGRDTTTTTDRVWGSAAFRYWLPEGPRDIIWTKNMLSRIFGMNIRPSVVYNAVPWSWLVDWFTGLGTLVGNLDNGVAERLAADYFYVMRETRTTTKRESYCRLRQGSSFTAVSATSTSGTITRSRLYGSPFGYNTEEFSLSNMQLSILGALGMSRLR